MNYEFQRHYEEVQKAIVDIQDLYNVPFDEELTKIEFSVPKVWLKLAQAMQQNEKPAETLKMIFEQGIIKYMKELHENKDRYHSIYADFAFIEESEKVWINFQNKYLAQKAK